MPSKFLNLLNIRTRLLLLCLAVSTPLLVIGIFVIWKEYQSLNSEAKRATSFQAALAVRALSNWIAAEKEEITSAAALAESNISDPKKLSGTLDSLLAGHQDWNVLAVCDSNGRIIAGTDKNADQFPTRLLKSDEHSLFTGGIYPQCFFTGNPGLLAVVPMSQSRNLVCVVEPHAVLRLFQGVDDRSGSVIVVVDENQRVLARTLNNEHWLGRDYSNARTVRAAQFMPKGTIEAVSIADLVPRAYAFQREPQTNWLVVVGVPINTIYGRGHDRLMLMLLLVGCAFGLSGLLAYLATGRFTRTISELVKESLAIGRGDLTKRVIVEGNDELAMLGRAFNQMVSRLQLNQEHTHLVEHISESIRQSLDLNQIVNTTVNELGEALAASRCCVALLNDNHPLDAHDELVFNHVFFSPSHAGTPLKNKCLRLTENSLLKAIIEQGSILSMDVLDDSTFTPLLADNNTSPKDWQSIKSMLACPIVTQRPLGLILIHQCDDRRVWTDSELELVDAVARHVALAMEQARLYEQTKTLAEQELLINHIVRSMRSSLDLDTILKTVTKELGEALLADRCQIVQPRPEEILVVTHESKGATLPDATGLSIYGSANVLDISESGFAHIFGLDLKRLLSDTVGADATLEDTISIIRDVNADGSAKHFSEFLNKQGTRSLIAAPLIDNSQLLGVLLVHQNAMRDWKQSEIGLVRALADQTAVAINHARLFAQVRHQAVTDGLTELYNHVYLKKRLTEELKRAQRKLTSCSLLMIDLDKLKQINDTFGHPVGDAAIRQVSMALRNQLRSSDTAARYGGEEFAVILPETSASEAALIADRLCRQVNANPVSGLGNISVSIGSATFPSDASGLEDLIDKADKALYEAKHGGRNQARSWGDFAQNALGAE